MRAGYESWLTATAYLLSLLNANSSLIIWLLSKNLGFVEYHAGRQWWSQATRQACGPDADLRLLTVNNYYYENVGLLVLFLL